MSLIENNTKDPLTGKIIKNIYVKKISKKTGNEIWHQKWQYYRNRKKLSIGDFYRQNTGKTIQITFFGESQQTLITVPKYNKELECFESIDQ